jgi:isocitrate/isopropylmalate dehydrogenase
MPAGRRGDSSRIDAIFLGAVGDPCIAPEEVAGVGTPCLRSASASISTRTSARSSRSRARPTRWLVAPAEPDAIDFVVVREATEGMYVGLGGRFSRRCARAVAAVVAASEMAALSREIALQTGVYSEAGCRRVIERAFLLAEERDGRRLVTSATKANAMKHGMTLWNDVFADVASPPPGCRELSGTTLTRLAMRMVLKPR